MNIKTGLAKYAWFTLGWNVLVILWGAYVRASGSGAGCGSHWPTCNGQVIPVEPQIETMVEFTHRLTSGVAMLLVLGLLIWVWRSAKPGEPVRRGAVLSAIFIIIEALVGAGLVLFGLTANNDSVARAVVIAIHLANTFLLLAALSLTAWWASGGGGIHLKGNERLGGVFLVGFGAMLILGMTGAITALGDTLFPAGTLLEGIQQDISPTAHFLIRLRVIHPLVAMIAGVYLFVLTIIMGLQRTNQRARLLSLLMIGLFFVQLVVGVINIALLAPVVVQIIHLLLADLIWIVLVLMAAAAFEQPQPQALTEISPQVNPAAIS